MIIRDSELDLKEIALQKLLKVDRTYYKDNRYKLYEKYIKYSNRPIIGYENDNLEKWYIRDAITGDLIVDWETFNDKEVPNLKLIRNISEDEINLMISIAANRYESYFNTCSQITEANRTCLDDYYIMIEFWVTDFEGNEKLDSINIRFNQ